MKHIFLDTFYKRTIGTRVGGGGGKGEPIAFQILVDKLTLFQLEGEDYAHQITTCPPFWIFKLSYDPVLNSGLGPRNGLYACNW